MYSTNKISRSFAFAILATALISSFFAFVPVARAESPSGCGTSNIQQTPTKSPTGAVYDGSTITYTVTYSNVDPDGVGGVQPCDITLADAVINLPGGGTIPVLNDVNFPVGTSISCPGGPGCAAGPYTYVVNHADEVAGVVTTNFQIQGTLQDIIPLAASDADNLASIVIHPSTVTTISSTATSVEAGDTVTLTVTEQNDGSVALTNVSVVVDNGVGTLSAPPTSGDTGNDSILGVGETWSWTVPNVVVNSDTTFTATGHGMDPNGNDITWCANPQSPPASTRCDQDEQDSVTVDVVLPLVVEKTASGSYERDWTWSIDKVVTNENDLLLAEGESYTVNYLITVGAVSANVNHHVEGTITITNPSGNPDATINSLADIADELDSGAMMGVNCESVGFPVVLNGGDTLYCTYGGSASGTEDTNTVTVTTTGSVPGGSDTADIVWAANPSNVTDECVTVNDTNPQGPQDVEICADAADKTLDYSITFGPETNEDADVVIACGADFNHPNTADFVTNDNQEVGDDDANVHVAVDCFEGCTLTQGYWKTHSREGKAPYDDNWANLGVNEEDTAFFLSGTTWYNVFWTAPKGNVYYNLAHQYMAAKLNDLNGASVPGGVAAAMTAAEGLLGTKTPADAAGLKGAAKNTWVNLAATLASFNEGLIGPGHCDENPVI